jgi:hypothetical protein
MRHHMSVVPVVQAYQVKEILAAIPEQLAVDQQVAAAVRVLVA